MVKYLIGPIIFLILLFVPTSLSSVAQNFLAIFVWVICNWLFTEIPLFISGIFGVCLAVFFQIASPSDALTPFASPTIFLFLGGFLFAKAMNNLALDEKISLTILNIPLIRGSNKKVIAACYFITAWFSMWISNTATTAMMLPIFMGILDQLKLKDKKYRSTLLLGLAYSASIGGLGTPIGSPPNMIAISFLKELAGIDINFFDWFLRGFPLVIIFTAIVVFYILRKVEFDTEIVLKPQVKQKTSTAEKYLMVLFSITIIGWFTPGIVSVFKLPFPYLENLSTEIVGLFFASFLFVFPFRGPKILAADDITGLDWGTLLLFGSGISLGKMLFSSGLASSLAQYLEILVLPQYAFVTTLLLIYLTIFATELASNTATANILIPILIALYLKLGIHPTNPVIGVAIACSLAFMLPVGTPPNAIVYGTKQVSKQEMIKTGLWLNIMCGFVIFLVMQIF
jgi:sodium-dependent dicarboxylate transporter 2/3/5